MTHNSGIRKEVTTFVVSQIAGTSAETPSKLLKTLDETKTQLSNETTLTALPIYYKGAQGSRSLSGRTSRAEARTVLCPFLAGNQLYEL